MVLQSAFGYSLMFTKSLSDAAHAALRRASELAEHFQDFDYQLRTLAGLAACCHRLEDFEGARVIGRRAEAVASQASDPVSLSIADWVLGTSLLFLGEYGRGVDLYPADTPADASAFGAASPHGEAGKGRFHIRRLHHGTHSMDARTSSNPPRPRRMSRRGAGRRPSAFTLHRAGLVWMCDPALAGRFGNCWAVRLSAQSACREVRSERLLRLWHRVRRTVLGPTRRTCRRGTVAPFLPADVASASF